MPRNNATWAAFLNRVGGRHKARGFLPLGFDDQVRDVFAELASSVERHGRVPIPGFGVFRRVDRPARRLKVLGHADVDVPATWSISFRNSKRTGGRR